MTTLPMAAPLEGDSAYRDACNRWCSAGRRALAIVAGAITREALGHVLGITRQAASGLLAGTIRPGLELAVRIETTFGIAPRLWTIAPFVSKESASCVAADVAERRLKA